VLPFGPTPRQGPFCCKTRRRASTQRIRRECRSLEKFPGGWNLPGDAGSDLARASCNARPLFSLSGNSIRFSPKNRSFTPTAFPRAAGVLFLVRHSRPGGPGAVTLASGAARFWPASRGLVPASAWAVSVVPGLCGSGGWPRDSCCGVLSQPKKFGRRGTRPRRAGLTFCKLRACPLFLPER
jgi:hypothetical protein